MINLYLHIRASGKADRLPTICEVGIITYDGINMQQCFSQLVAPLQGEVVPPLWTNVTHAGCAKHGLPMNYIMPVVAKLVRTCDAMYAFGLNDQVALLRQMHELLGYDDQLPLDRIDLQPHNTVMFQHLSAAGVCGVLRKHHQQETERKLSYDVEPPVRPRDKDKKPRQQGHRRVS